MDQGDRQKNIAIVARFLIFDHDVTASLGSKIKSKLEGQIVVSTYIVITFLNTIFKTI